MAPAKDLLSACLIVAALLLIQPLPSSVGNFLSPLLPPLPEDLCNGVECGKGSCKPSGNSSLSYECECEPGWKQVQDLKFLPCVIPNCSLDLSCSKGQSTPQEKSHAANESFLNPCHWADCGGGSCNKTSLFSYSCVCDAGYYNLLNVSVFPCFQQCALGLDCTNLGISTSANRSTTPPSVAETGGNYASSVVHGRSWWPPIILMLFFGVLHWS